MTHHVRGIWVPKDISKEFAEEAFDYEPRDDDVILVSYPKTGTILLSYIVHQIVTDGETLSDLNDLIYRITPFSFLAGASGLDAITTKPRIYKHHFTLDKVKYNPQSKMIYIYRRPEDNVVSIYYFYKELGFIECDFNENFENYLKGDVLFGSYFDHILSYNKLKNHKNILFVTYENLLLNKKEEILRIAHFLGKEYFDKLSRNEFILNKIIKNTSFQCMKKNLPFQYQPPDINTMTIKINFFRKGEIGDGQNVLNEDQRKRLMNHVKDKLKGTDIVMEWYGKDD